MEEEKLNKQKLKINLKIFVILIIVITLIIGIFIGMMFSGNRNEDKENAIDMGQNIDDVKDKESINDTSEIIENVSEEEKEQYKTAPSEDEENILTFALNELYGIEEYIDVLHPYGRSIPDFNDINEADEDWVWFTVRTLINNVYQKIEDCYMSYDGITKIANMIFGNDFKENFPEEGNYYLRYENGYYEVNGHFGWPEGHVPSYILNDVVKQDDDIYKATIVEYNAEYLWEMNSEGEVTEESVRLYNGENYYENFEKYIKEFLNYDRVTVEREIKDYVLKNIDKFTTKELIIKLDENNNFNIVSCKTIK